MEQRPITESDLQAAVPDTSKPFRLRGLEAPVEVFRDRYGIPHISAGTDHDALFAQGFVTAQDRLWHMDYDRRHAYGRLAEWLGSAFVEQDITMRRFQIHATVESDYRAVDPETRGMLDAYTAGVNAFIENADVLPIEYRLIDDLPEPWQAWDCFAVYKVRHIMMGVFEGKLWRARLVNALGPEAAARLLRGYQRGHLVIVPPGHEYGGPELNGLAELSRNLEALQWLREEPHGGSNSWAVHGSRTASGKPLLAGDSHRALNVPNVYYQNHIACPAFDVIGMSFPGCPGFPHFGHNGRVAWCVTHAQADYQDVYLERFSLQDAGTYAFRGEWKQAEVRPETIHVRGGESKKIVVIVTHHGPIIGGDPEKGFGLSFKYTATAAPYQGFQCLLPMMKAASVEEMDAAMRQWIDPCNNFLFADVHGDIAYLHRGQVPIRSMANAWLPVPGWTGEYEWKEDIPFEEMPRIRNPEAGFIVTANNRIPDEDYPYYIALNYAPEYRARRIFERLQQATQATVDQMKGVHGDCISIPARVFSKHIAECDPPDEVSARAQTVVATWDGAMEQEAVAPTIYSAFRLQLLRRVLKHLVGPLREVMFTATGRGAPRHLSELASVLVTAAQKEDTSLLPPGRDWQGLAAEALGAAVSDLRRRLGDDMQTWQWGEVHRTHAKHPLSDLFPKLKHLLDPPSVSMGGDADTPLAAGYAPGRPFEVTLLSVVRYVFDTADWDSSGWAVPLGVSGHPGSPHYADQVDAWKRVELVPMLYSWDRIRTETVAHQTLRPG